MLSSNKLDIIQLHNQMELHFWTQRIWLPDIRQHFANIDSIMIKPIFLLNQ